MQDMQIDLFLKDHSIEVYDINDVIFKIGDNSDKFYFVLEGVVELIY